jgi:hypothetical protein
MGERFVLTGKQPRKSSSASNTAALHKIADYIDTIDVEVGVSYADLKKYFREGNGNIRHFDYFWKQLVKSEVVMTL